MLLFQHQQFFERWVAICHFCCKSQFLWTLWLICLHEQRLDAGDDPVNAFVLSSEAALSGAEATKHMQPQVILIWNQEYNLQESLQLCLTPGKIEHSKATCSYSLQLSLNIPHRMDFVRFVTWKSVQRNIGSWSSSSLLRNPRRLIPHYLELRCDSQLVKFLSCNVLSSWVLTQPCTYLFIL